MVALRSKVRDPNAPEKVMSRVLITGASKGIGRATARELVVRGHEVVATARDVRTLDDLPVDTRLTLDVTDQASVDRAVAAAGDLDALVSNAGETLPLRAPVESVPLAEVERLFQLNTLGALRVAQAVLPGLRARGGGRVLFVSSVLGRLTIPLSGAYAASKWALEALAETLAVEVGHFGISVTLLQPGAVSSGGSERAPTYLGDDDPYLPLAQQLAGARGSYLFITVEDVAAAVADDLEQDSPPLRIPVGAWAEAVLAARAATPEGTPFRIAPLEW
jgi:NAD(P)-dependent dehydrogenase (short-subunit alcohol dehydrogenase family)